jgi:hypothetical protein
MPANKSLERTVGHRCRTVLAIDCALAGAEEASCRSTRSLGIGRVKMQFPRGQLAWAWIGLPVVAAIVMIVAQRGGLNQPFYWNIALPALGLMVAHAATIIWRWASGTFGWRAFLVALYVPSMIVIMLAIMIYLACIHGDCF